MQKVLFALTISAASFVATADEAAPNTALANPSVEAIERALASRNVPAIVEACGRFTHRAGTFRAFVSNGAERIVGARDTLAQTEKAHRQAQSEVARLRRNAEVSDQATPLDPKDNSHRVRAAETRKRADQLESRSNAQVKKAKETFESSLAALGAVIRNVRESDAEDLRKRTQQVQMERERSERLTAIKMFLASLEEPGGRPAFAAKSVEPSYQATLELINGKLAASHWQLRYGAKSNAFILQHPGGAFFVEFSSLNAQVKSGIGTDERHEVQLEVAHASPALRTISKEGTIREDVRSIAIPCASKVDAQNLAQAFRHLVLMAGGKDDQSPG